MYVVIVYVSSTRWKEGDGGDDENGDIGISHCEDDLNLSFGGSIENS